MTPRTALLAFSYAGRSNEPPRALGVYVRKGAAQPLPSRQEPAHGPQVFRGPVPLHPAGWPELGQRAQELAALPERVPGFRNCEARACNSCCAAPQAGRAEEPEEGRGPRSEEHTSELQSHSDLVCRLLLEKKKTI